MPATSVQLENLGFATTSNVQPVDSLLTTLNESLFSIVNTAVGELPLTESAQFVNSLVAPVDALPSNMSMTESLIFSSNNVSPVMLTSEVAQFVNSLVAPVDALPSNMNMTESLIFTANNVSPVLLTSEVAQNVNSAVSTQLTYGFTDNAPIVVGNTAAASNTQTWYVG